MQILINIYLLFIPFYCRKKKKYKKKKPSLTFEPVMDKKQNYAENWEHFNRLCAGEKMISADVERQFKCYHLTNKDPYLRLGPFKLDVQHTAPFIGVFRNILYDDEMKHYKVTCFNLEKYFHINNFLRTLPVTNYFGPQLTIRRRQS